MRIPRFFLATFTGAWSYFLFVYSEPILALRVDEFNLTQNQIGLFFAVQPVFYIVMSIVVQWTPRSI